MFRIFVLRPPRAILGQGCVMRDLRFGSLVLATGLALSLASCSGGTVDSGAGSGTAALPARFSMRVAHTDKRFDAPSFVWLSGATPQNLKLSASATPVDVAWASVRAAQSTLKVSPASLASAQIAAIHDTGRGAIIARFKQQVGGIPVFNAQMNVAMRRDKTPLAITGVLAPSVKVLSAKGWALDERTAVGNAFKEITGYTPSANGYSAAGVNGAGANRWSFTVSTPENVYFNHAITKKVYYPNKNGVLPAWYVELTVGNAENSGQKSRSFVFDAADGSKLFDHNLVVSDSVKYRVWADGTGPKGYAPMDSPEGNGNTPYGPAAYTPADVEPPFISSNLIQLGNVPFSQSATDFWLSSSATHLAGNNAYAYADIVAPDGFSAGDIDTTPTSPGVFDRTWDPSTPSPSSTSNIQAVTTNLFFTMNYMHDLFYDSGFDEVSGNPQASNYGRGGVEGDDIHAEAQDYSGLDNANANAHSDGEHPVVQMYLWDFNPGSASHLKVNSPASVAQDDFDVGVGAAAGQKTFNLTGDLVYYVDTTTSTGGNGHNACNAPSNAAALSGKICVVDQGGGCVSGAKADNCVAAGAVGMMMVLSSDTVGGILGATDPSLDNFAALAVGNTVGTSLETAMGSGTVNVTMIRPLPNRDGSVDGTILSHEWGHIMSNRLIGDGNGLFNAQGSGMGEGWSDFVALQTYIRLTDLSVPSNNNWNGVYPMGAYALGGDPVFLYWGIRRYPYSNDMTKDPLTFKHIQEGQAMPTNPPINPSPLFGFDPAGAGNSEAHNVGEIWASTLWDCYVGMLRDTANHSYDDAITTMRDYIVASYKMTPIGPTMLEARDALLLAALSNTAKPNDFNIFAAAFARRGMGVGAVGPDSSSTDLTGVVESNFVGADLEFAGVTIADDTSSCDNDGILDSGETGTVKVYMNNTGWTTLTAATVKLSSTNANVSFPSGDTVTFASTGPFESNVASVKIKITGVTGITNVPIKIDLDAPAIGPTAGPRSQTLTVNTNFDYANASSESDDFDDPHGPWTFGHDSTAGFGSQDWQTAPADGTFDDLSWIGLEQPVKGDMYLVSPTIAVGAATGSPTATIQHAWAFEQGQLGATIFN